MTWRPHPLPPVPEATAAAVKAAFPKGNLYVDLHMGERRRKNQLTKALVAPCPVEERHSLLEASDGLMIVTLGLVDSAEGLVR